jgi:hypothetical protein
MNTWAVFLAELNRDTLSIMKEKARKYDEAGQETQESKTKRKV